MESSGIDEGITDRDLLRLAAKAAGIKLRWDGLDDGVPHLEENFVWWSPLEDDGDAMSLAVKLCIGITNAGGVSRAYINSDGNIKQPSEPHGSSPAAANRRAIVRAAAMIGMMKIPPAAPSK